MRSGCPGSPLRTPRAFCVRQSADAFWKVRCLGMPWQSIYSFKGGTNKPKERSPAPASDAGSSGDHYVVSSQTQGPETHNTLSATEYLTNPHVHFASDACPARSMQTSSVTSVPAPAVPSGRSNPLYGHPDYTLLKPLNEGTFGSVHLVLDRRTNEQVAMKFLERGPGVSKSVLREILNHRLCVVHPSIVQFKEVFLTPKYLAIVMEYAAGGDMFEYVIKNKSTLPCQGLSEDSARWFFQQLVVALEFCHELGIANRDIKLENLLLDDAQPLPHVKICDFGYSKNEYVDSRPKTVSGTPDYIAPEVLLHDQYDGKKADVWSCGVMLYVMLTGVLPFAKRGDERGNNLVRLQQMFPRIVAADFNQPQHVSPECRHLLSRLLTADPELRITTSEVLRHPWFLYNLPAGMDLLNYNLLQSLVPPGLQRVEELERIVQEATVDSPWSGWGPKR